MLTANRRSILKLLGGASAGILAAERGLYPASAQSQSFVWSSTAGTWGDKLREIFIEKPNFAKQTGLQPTLAVEMDSVAASKAVASCGNPPFDVSSAGQPEIAVTQGASCLEDYDPAIVTHLNDIYQGARVANYYAPFAILAFGLVWNKNKIDDPADWTVLADKKFRGRVAIPGFSWYGMPWLHAVNKFFGGNEDDVTPGIQFAAKLVKDNDAVVIENADHGSQVFQRDEVDIMPFFNGRAVRLAASGLPTRFKMVKDGITVGVGFTILKGTKHKQAANIFVNNTLTPELQTAFASWSKYPPTNKTAVVPPDLEAFRVSDEVFRMAAKLDYAKINKNRSANLDRWNREVLR
jgi:putative spermidine/putrescine transport system substrate-binding protein